MTPFTMEALSQIRHDELQAEAEHERILKQFSRGQTARPSGVFNGLTVLVVSTLGLITRGI